MRRKNMILPKKIKPSVENFVEFEKSLNFDESKHLSILQIK